MADGWRNYGVGTTFRWILLLIAVSRILANEGKASIKLYGNLSQFTSLSGRHELLNTQLLLGGGASKLGDVPPKGDSSGSGSIPKQESVVDRTFGDIYLQGEARLIGSHLRKVSNEELGVTAMQTIYDSLVFTPAYINPKEQVDEISEKMQKKFEKYVSILEKNNAAVENLFKQHQKYPLSTVNPCCLIDPSVLNVDHHFGTEISKSTSCDTAPSSLPLGVFSPGPNLTEVFKQNLEDYPTIKWQYFLSASGIHTEYPAYSTVRTWSCKHIDDLRHRDIYLATIKPFTKHVVIVIDHGNSLSSTQLSTAKAVGKYILSTLSHHDKVGLIGLAGVPKFPKNNKCLSEQMAYATYEAKDHFTRFIDSLEKASDSTNHIMGFSKAFEMVSNSLHSTHNNSKQEALIVYVSRGLLSSLTDARHILEAIAEGNRKNSHNHRIIINTYAVIDDGKPIMYETDFLQDVAEQNYGKYNVQGPSLNSRGVMVAVNSTENLSYTVGRFYSVLSTHSSSLTYFSLPWWDSISGSLLVSMSQTVTYKGQLLGIVGLDVAVSDLAEDITYFLKYPELYSFLLDKSGVTLMHPSFMRPLQVSEQPMHTDILYLENQPFFNNVRAKILNESEGETILELPSFKSHEDINMIEKDYSKHRAHLKYSWKKIEGTPYIVCVASHHPTKLHPELKGGATQPTYGDFVYHRLDLIPASKLCRHMKQLATLSTSSLFLSASSFLSPFEYLSQEETKQMVQGYMAYLIDKTKLIANPGLRPEVRNEVLAVAQITSEWKKKFEDNEFTKYIVRRFAATSHGVFLVYPGTVIHHSFDPTEREWYTRAMEHPGKVVLTAPYLDAGGSGYIVTLSHTIYEAKPAAMHSTSDAVVTVIGMDLTLGYFYKLLLDVMPICEQDKISCLILDDRGYLIAHPGLTEPSGHGPVEQQHITHMEPLVANDIVNHNGFVKKKLCNSFSDRTVQRFYKFNTSLEGILTNLVHGEHCAKYQITSVPGTNIFLGIVNHTCDTVTAFCPCSMSDRTCLNCNRMEQTECECPCECPLKMNLCTGELMNDEDDNPSCPHFSEEPRLPKVDSTLLESLPYCFDSRCYSRLTEKDCFGVLGCEWCELDGDGITALKKPFCTEQRKCFGGVFGAQTPYADEIVGQHPEEFHTIKSTPVGPVAGGMMACFLVVALGVYCYRHHVARGTTAHYISSRPNGTVRMSHLDNEPDDPEIHDEPSPVVGHSNMILASFENSAIVSPYRINTGYRRPPGGDSDHGYSTMTPHEDSEHLPYIEPLLIGKDRNRAPLSQQSISSCSRASSPSVQGQVHNVPPPVAYTQQVLVPTWHHQTSVGMPWWSTSTTIVPNQRDPSQTVLPEVPNRRSSHILTNAQVHMVDSR